MLSQWCWAELALFQELGAEFWNYWFEHAGELEGSCENLGITIPGFTPSSSASPIRNTGIKPKCNYPCTGITSPTIL
jgi:hypothetical protein